jgi:hypothetical protein
MTWKETCQEEKKAEKITFKRLVNKIAEFSHLKRGLWKTVNNENMFHILSLYI